MIATIFSFVVDLAMNSGWVGGIAGLASTALGFFTKGSLRWILLAVAVAAVGFWIMGLKLHIAHQDTTIATLNGKIETLNGQVARAKVDLATCATTNTENAAIYKRQEAQHAASDAAFSKALAEAKRANITTEKVYVAAQQCSGVPPALRAIIDGVRERQDAAAPGD